MATLRPSQMVPGRVYRVAYQVGAKLLHHEGKYLGREVTHEGDYLLFEYQPFGSQPFEILLASVRSVEAGDDNRGSDVFSERD